MSTVLKSRGPEIDALDTTDEEARPIGWGRIDAAADAAIPAGGAWLIYWKLNLPTVAAAFASHNTEGFWMSWTPAVVFAGVMAAAAAISGLQRTKGFFQVPVRWAGLCLVLAVFVWLADSANVNRLAAKVGHDLAAAQSRQLGELQEDLEQAKADLGRFEAMSDDEKRQHAAEIEHLVGKVGMLSGMLDDVRAEHGDEWEEFGGEIGSSSNPIEDLGEIEERIDPVDPPVAVDPDQPPTPPGDAGSTPGAEGESDPGNAKPGASGPPSPVTNVPLSNRAKEMIALAGGLALAAMVPELTPFIAYGLEKLFGLSPRETTELMEALKRSSPGGTVDPEKAKAEIAKLKTPKQAMAMAEAFRDSARNAKDPADKARYEELAKAADEQAEQLKAPDYGSTLDDAWSETVKNKTPNAKLLVEFYDAARRQLTSDERETEGLVDKCEAYAKTHGANPSAIAEFRKNFDEAPEETE